MKLRLFRTVLGTFTLLVSLGVYSGVASASSTGCDGSYAAGTLNCYGQTAQGVTAYGYFTRSSVSVFSSAGFVLQNGLLPITGGSCDYSTNACPGASTPSQGALEDYIYCMYYGESQATLNDSSKTCKDRFGSGAFYENYSGQNKRGASFIVNTMLGNRSPGQYSVSSAMWTDWKSRVDAASLSLVPDLAYGNGINSAYFPTIGDDAFYHQGSGGSGDSIVVSSGGKQYILQIACANPVGNSEGLPNNSWSGTGKTTVGSSDWTAGSSINFTNTVTISKAGSPSVNYEAWSWGGWFSSQQGVSAHLGYTNQDDKPSMSGNYSYTAAVSGPTSHIGDWYCEFVRFSPPSSSGSGYGFGDVVCKQLLAPPNSPPYGNINIACNAADGSATITYTWGDPNGANGQASAYTQINTSKPPSNSYSGTTLYNWGWTYRAPGDTGLQQTLKADQTTGTNYVWLYVKDAGSGTNTYYNVGTPVASAVPVKCAHPPTGNISVGACQADGTVTVTYTWGDLDGANGLASAYTQITNTTPASNSYSGATLQGWGWKYRAPGDTPATQTTTTSTAWNTYNVWLYVKDAGSGTDAYYRVASATVGPCAVVSCSANPSSLAGNLVIGATATFTVNAAVVGAATPPPAPVPPFTVVVKDPSGVVQTLSPASPVPYDSYSSGKVYSKQISFKPTNTKAGTYTVAVSWSYPGHSTGTASGCADSAKAGYAPYFSVAGGDVSAGPGFGSSCSPVSTAGIKGWNQGSTGSFAGAGTTLGAFALGQIYGFATAQGGATLAGATGSPGVPSQLAFANTGAGVLNVPSGIYGGQSGQSGCVPDYAGQASTGAVAAAPDYATAGTRTYSLSGNQTLGAITVGKGVHVTLVVTGNVYLSGAITYADYTGGSVNDIPQFQLLVKGNIYINSTVSTLYGFYDAQPNGAGTGIIHTCATAPGVASTSYGSCSTTQLTFYGAVAAQSIYLERSYGNLVSVNGIPADAAEKVVFTPELWMSAAQSPTSGAGLDDWQSVAGLPPIL